MVCGKGASVSSLWFKLDFSGGNWWCPRLNFIIFPDNCRCPWSWNKFAVNMLNRSDWDSNFYSEKKQELNQILLESKNFAGGGSAVNSAVQSLRGAAFVCACAVQCLQVVPECCWRTSQVVSICVTMWPRDVLIKCIWYCCSDCYVVIEDRCDLKQCSSWCWSRSLWLQEPSSSRFEE